MLHTSTPTARLPAAIPSEPSCTTRPRPDSDSARIRFPVVASCVPSNSRQDSSAPGCFCWVGRPRRRPYSALAYPLDPRGLPERRAPHHRPKPGEPWL